MRVNIFYNRDGGHLPMCSYGYAPDKTTARKTAADDDVN